MSDPNWKNKLSFLKPTSTQHEVFGKQIGFYALSTRMLFSMSSLSRPLAQALSSLFEDKSSDNGRILKDFRIPGENGLPEEQASETVIQPVDLEILKIRLGTRERSVDRLIDAFSDENNKRLLAAIIFDSCRDLFPRNPEESDLDEFMEQLDLSGLVQFLTGVGKANSRVFGPLGERVSEAFKSHLETLPKVDADPDESAPSMTSEVPTPSPTASPSPRPMPPTPPPMTRIQVPGS